LVSKLEGIVEILPVPVVNPIKVELTQVDEADEVDEAAGVWLELCDSTGILEIVVPFALFVDATVLLIPGVELVDDSI
jgi:hypothetical protein